jgi:hypothetical protein
MLVRLSALRTTALYLPETFFSASDIRFCLKLRKPQGLVEGIMQIKEKI